MRSSTISRTVILGQKHRPAPFARGSAGDRIAVDRRADAGRVLTVCLRANHTSRTCCTPSGFAGRIGAGTGEGALEGSNSGRFD